MKKENSSTSMAKLVMVVSLIVSIGVVIWLMGYLSAMQKNKVVPGGEIKKTVTAHSEIINWKTYKWQQLNFKYPHAWEVEGIYYSTPAQMAQKESPKKIGLRIFPSKGEKMNDFIAIGGRQVNCDFPETHARCYYIPEIGNYIYTDSNSNEVFQIFDKIISTFEFIEKDEVVSVANQLLLGDLKFILPDNWRIKTKSDFSLNAKIITADELQFDFTLEESENYSELGSGKYNFIKTEYGSAWSGISTKSNMLISISFDNDQFYNMHFDFGDKIIRPEEISQIWNMVKSIKMISENENWKTYRNEEYGYKFKYPEIRWILTSKIHNPILDRLTNNSINSLSYVNLYTQGNDEEGKTITFSVYEKDSDHSMLQWLSSALPNLLKTDKGDLTAAFKKASSGITGLLTYDEIKEDDIEISMFGLMNSEGFFSYVTFFHRIGSSFVYSIELRFPPYYTSEPEQYIGTYNQILSTFKFIEK